MPIYKRCSRCNARIPEGTKCRCINKRNKEYDKRSRNLRNREFYNSASWQAARQTALRMDGMDVYEFMTSGKIIAADTVHHVVPLNDDWEKRLDINNLMSLSNESHSRIEREYINDKAGMIEKMQVMLTEFRRLQARGAV